LKRENALQRRPNGFLDPTLSVFQDRCLDATFACLIPNLYSYTDQFGVDLIYVTRGRVACGFIVCGSFRASDNAQHPPKPSELIIDL